MSGRDSVVLSHPSGSRAEVRLQGAHVTSFVDCRGRELLFLSPLSRFDSGKAVRGGVPVIWPQFGPGKLPQHGFARTSTWSLSSGPSLTLGVVTAAFSLRGDWQGSEYSLDLELRMSSEELEIRLSCLNCGTASPFSFTAALHTYLKVSDVRSTVVRGLRGVKFVDSSNLAGPERSEDAEDLEFGGKVDRQYHAAPDELVVKCGMEVTSVSKRGFADVVVWNPAAQDAAKMADLGAENWTGFVCVEAAELSPVTLQPGAKWSATQIISSACAHPRL